MMRVCGIAPVLKCYKGTQLRHRILCLLRALVGMGDDKFRYSTVTDLARLRGWSTFFPLLMAM